MSSASGGSAPAIVEDVFLTNGFLVKGRLSNKYRRLTTMLDHADGSFLSIHDVTMVALRGHEVIRTPSLKMNPNEIIFAHELLELSGDTAMRVLAQSEKTVHIRAFYNGSVHIELAGKVAPRAYDPGHNGGRPYFIMQRPQVRGLNLKGNDELRVLDGLEYITIRKDRLAYIYDFG